MICKECNIHFNHDNNKKLRCPTCDKAIKLKQWREYYHRNYIKKGRAKPKGKESPLYRLGTRAYQKQLKTICEFCDVTGKRLLVHHIDENRKNNECENLATLCYRCHLIIHNRLRDKKGRLI